MNNFLNTLRIMLMHHRAGATAIEYGLIAALISVAAVGAMSNIGGQIGKSLNNVTTKMSKG